MINESELKAKHSEQSEEMQRLISEKDKTLQTYRKEHGRLQVFFDMVLERITPVETLPAVELGQPKTGRAIIPVLQITDTHMGAIQESREIEGFNEYSPAIAWARGLDLSERFINWVLMHRTAYNVSECVILMTGDLISGDIHDELKITNAFPSPVQVVEAAKFHASQISLIAPHFDKVTIEFISEDNHARLTKKPQAKEAGYNSLNFLVGKMLEGYLSKHENVTINIYPMLEKVVDVNGRKYLISHGHGIKGWGGIPWYGIERKVGKESQARLGLIMRDIERARDIGFHKYIFGHFHTPIDLPLYSCGGSMSGTDAYDHQNGRISLPSQPAWMVHPEHGEFNRINFML